jgi:transcriptional regulator with XRE-family HTH domain
MAMQTPLRTASLEHLLHLGARLRSYRRALGYTCPQFACLLGMSEEHLWRLEAGRWPSAPSQRLRARMEDMLGITIPDVREAAPSRGRRRAGDRSPVAPQTLGDRVRQRRLVLELSQATVAARTRVHVTSICRWEKDRSRPTVRMLARLARALECPVTVLTQEEASW